MVETPRSPVEQGSDKIKVREIAWVQQQVKAELNALQTDVQSGQKKETFYSKVENGDANYDIGLVVKYLDSIKDNGPEQLKAKNTSAWIMAVQIGLKALGYGVEVVDGVLASKGHFSSSETVGLIKKFQKDNGLEETGVPTSPTIKKLLEKLGRTVTGAPTSHVDSQGSTGKTQLNQKSKRETIPTKNNRTKEQFVNEVTALFKEDGNVKPEQISQVENKLKNYLKGSEFSSYQQFNSIDQANGKGYLLVDEGSELWLGTFKNGKLIEGIQLSADGSVKEIKNTGSLESLDNSRPFDQSPIGETFKKLKEAPAGLSEETVTAWKKQAEEYFKNKNPKEYVLFSVLAAAKGKGYVYDSSEKSLNIGVFENGKLVEGILLNDNKVLTIQAGEVVKTTMLFEQLTPQQEATQTLKVQKRNEISEKISTIGAGKINSVAAGKEKTLEALARGTREDLRTLERGLNELKNLISSNQELVMNDAGLRLELTNSLNVIKSSLEGKSRGFLNGGAIKDRLLKEVDGLLVQFSVSDPIPTYKKKQDVGAVNLGTGAKVNQGENSGSALSGQNVEKTQVYPNVGPIPNYSDLNKSTSEEEKSETNETPVVPSQTPTPQVKNQKELERQQRIEAERASKAQKEAAEKAKKKAEQQAKEAERFKKEQEKQQKIAEEQAKKAAQEKAAAKNQPNKAPEKKEQVSKTKELTRESKFEDLAVVTSNGLDLDIKFNEGVVKVDGKREYILINGEKYYKYTDKENEQDPKLKYYYLNTNTPMGIEIEFGPLEDGYVQKDFSFVPEK